MSDGIFLLALTNVLINLLYIIPGYVSGKLGKLNTGHIPPISFLMIYACGPCMLISSFLGLDYSTELLKNLGLMCLLSFVIMLFFMGIVFFCVRKKCGFGKYEQYKDMNYRILTVASMMGNVGYFGLPLVKALFPDHPEVACYAVAFVFTMNLLIFTVGSFFMSGDKKYISLKEALLNPTTVGFVIGLIFLFTGAKNWLPSALQDGIILFGKMATPICMVLLGIRLSSMKFLDIFKSPMVYVSCLLKQVAFPLFALICVLFLPIDSVVKASILILSATPCAALVFNFAELHRASPDFAARVLLLSTMSSCITIPLLSLLTAFC